MHQPLRRSYLFVLLLLGIIPATVRSQGLAGTPIHGNFQFDGQFYHPDSAIGTPDVPEKFLNNGYANFNYEGANFYAGLRYESYLNPLLGYDKQYQGSGLPYRYIGYKNDNLDITVGNFYEQFGSGIVLRSYEEKTLGIDNAIDGIRLKFKPYAGIYLKGLVGRQRNYFTLGEGLVRGFDAEVNFNESISSWAEKKTKFVLGGSFVSKYQVDQDPIYILPENVGCYGFRTSIMNGGWTFTGEFVHKINDPSIINHYIYKDGNSALVTLGYSHKGFGATLAAKRVDNMNFRSERDATGNSLYINYLPALTKNHTSILPAIYPYATQANGEMAMQAEVFFNLKPGTPLGGKLGTDVNVNYSRAQDIYKTNLNDSTGYDSQFFKLGDEIFFEDFNIEINHRWSKSVRNILSYVYINYNKDVIEGRDGFGHVYSHSVVLETIWKITNKKTLRSELQHLFTEQDQQSWALALVEYTIAPKWSIAAFDEYNYGNKHQDIYGNYDGRLHYYTATVAFTQNANRFSIGYGRQRAGILCVGGVCRNVPASSGFSLSVSSTF